MLPKHGRGTWVRQVYNPQDSIRSRAFVSRREGISATLGWGSPRAMKPLRVAFVAALALPGAAQAAPLSSLAARELPLHGGAVTSAHARFDLVGLHWRGPGSVRFRTHRVA